MEVNAKKCAASAILHGQADAGLAKGAEEDKVIRSRLEHQIHLGRGTVPYLPPDKLHKYLGVLLTLTLNLAHQFRATMTLAIDQAYKPQSSFATLARKQGSSSHALCPLYLGFLAAGYQEARRWYDSLCQRRHRPHGLHA